MRVLSTRKGPLMSFLRIIILVFITLNFVACSRKSESETSKIQIQFDESVFSGKLSTEAKSNVVNLSGPDWGLSDPTSLSEINCFAIMVGAPEEGLNNSTCSTNGGNKLVFGPRAGFFPIDGKGLIEVPAGPKRTIYLLGSKSSEACFPGFAETTEFNFANYSNPFVIAKTTVDLAGAEQVVLMPLMSQFGDGNKLNDCDFFEPDDNDGGAPSLNPFVSNRMTWVDDNLIPRTVQVNHGGVSIDCSINGNAFAPCTTNNSFTWTITEYTAGSAYVVRVNYADGTSELLPEFKPLDEYPTLSFVTCDFEIASSTTTISPALTTSLATGGQNFCLANGTVLTFNQAGSKSLGDNTSLIVRQGGLPARIVNTNAGGGVFGWTPLSANPFIELIGIKLVSNGSSHAFNFQHSSTMTTAGLLLEESELVSNGPGDAIYAYSLSGSYSSSIYIYHSELKTSGGGESLEINGQAISAYIYDKSFLVSSNKAIQNYDGYVSIDDSKIVGKGGSSNPIGTFARGYTQMSSSKVIDESGLGNIVDCSISTYTASMDISDSVFIRANTNTAMNGAAINLNNQGSVCDPQVLSSSDDNVFCHLSDGTSGNAYYTGILGGDPIGGSPATPLVPANNFGPGTCPSGITL